MVAGNVKNNDRTDNNLHTEHKQVKGVRARFDKRVQQTGSVIIYVST